MSKNIVIQEDGVGKQISIDQLKIKVPGGGYDDYVPDDGIKRVKIHVMQNGTYKASDFGAYGISEVTVACTKNGGEATSEEDVSIVNAKSDVSPSEGGVARIFQALRLSTHLTAGGLCKWLRKSAVNLGTKSINVDSKVYKAADDNLYGYSQFTVSGISVQVVTDQDGNEHYVHTDGTGTETYDLPTSIEFIVQPDKLDYVIDEPISLQGAVIKAYNGDGTEWGDVPIGECILSPDTATLQGAGIYTTDGGIVAIGLVKSAYEYLVWPYTSEYRRTDYVCPTPIGGLYVGGGQVEGLYGTAYDGKAYFAKMVEDDVGFVDVYEQDTNPDPSNPEPSPYNLIAGTAVKAGYPYFTYNRLFDEVAEFLPQSSADPTEQTMDGAIASGCAVTVSWPRPHDGEVLQTSFLIQVSAYRRQE